MNEWMSELECVPLCASMYLYYLLNVLRIFNVQSWVVILFYFATHARTHTLPHNVCSTDRWMRVFCVYAICFSYFSCVFFSALFIFMQKSFKNLGSASDNLVKKGSIKCLFALNAVKYLVYLFRFVNAKHSQMLSLATCQIRHHHFCHYHQQR